MENRIVELSDEIRQAALTLGECLHGNAAVQDYLQLKTRAQADAELVELETRLEALYSDLVNREQAGETLDPEALGPYYELREQVRSHPLVFERDVQMERVKRLFADAGGALSGRIGIDYTMLAARQGE
jgi:hypothetical protein